MKRGAPLRRLSALRRSAPLSQRARSPRGIDPELRASVMTRDGGCRATALVRDVRCWGPLDPHHRRRRSQGGADSADNLLTVCRAHHQWIHEHPLEASVLGLLDLRTNQPTQPERG